MNDFHDESRRRRGGLRALGVQNEQVLLTWKQRARRIAGSNEDAWKQAYSNAEDPGLREVYGDSTRAPIRLICLPLTKAVNQGGLLRIADAFRLEMVGFEPEPDGAVDFAGNRGTMATQPYEWRSATETIDELKRNGYTIYALSLTDNAVALENCEWRFPCALVLGSENEGISEDVLSRCDQTVAIPLFGLITSLNVATAAGIVVHDAIRAYREIEPSFQPVRNGSRRLLDLPPVDYL